MKNRCNVLFIIVFLLLNTNLIDSKTVPSKVILNTIEKDFPAVQFNHESHETYTGDCAVCHHTHPAKSELSLCKNCHNLSNKSFKDSVGNTFMPCKTCHGMYNINSPSIPDLKVAYHQKCFSCHKDMGEIGKDPKGCLKICHIPNNGEEDLHNEK